ncbi:MAG: tRNA-dihydrouridine synthase [Actinomycetota bacterium]|nr:tRNA-dihydrouridine synthase [Actinomycetota bacterium]
MSTQPTRRRSVSVTLGVAAVLAATLSGCSADAADQEEYDYAAVCADQRTQLRVGDDDDCDESVSYAWYYIPVGSRAPAVGERVSGGSFDPPSSGEAVCWGGAPSEGGEVSRGGFGSCSQAVGG